MSEELKKSCDVCQRKRICVCYEKLSKFTHEVAERLVDISTEVRSGQERLIKKALAKCDYADKFTEKIGVILALTCEHFEENV